MSTENVRVSRDLRPHVDRFGNISVTVEIGGGPGTADTEKRGTGASNKPAAVAAFLRQLADDVEAAGRS
jgi:hypothetical protein